MVPPLNNLDRLDAADNNSSKPNPTNVIEENLYSNDPLTDVYWSVEIASRNKDARQPSKDIGLRYSWSFKKLERDDILSVNRAFYSFGFINFILINFLFDG